LQWLTKADPVLSTEISETWFDLSQGIMDVVIKLYVLSQMRAVVSGIERITPKLMRKVYEDELKPIHPMIDALRSGLKERIAKYSDLTIPHIDNKIIELSLLVQEQVEKVKSEPKFENNSSAMRLYRQLVDMGFESTLLEPLVYKAFRDNPSVGLKDIMPIVIEWYKSAEQTKPDKQSGSTNKIIPPKDWHTLDSDDLRFISNQADNADEFVEMLKYSGVMFDTDAWVDSYEL
jgi:hypothetical protein